MKVAKKYFAARLTLIVNSFV